MPDSENKPRGRHAASTPPPQPEASPDVLRDESNLYGDEGDIPARRKKKPASGAAAKKKKKTLPRKKAASKADFPKVAPKRKKRPRKRRRVYRSLYELMSATGSDSFFKPIRIAGREIRFWPLVLLAVVLLIASGVMLNNSNLAVSEQTVTVVGLPEDLEGYRIVVLSDMNGRRFGDEQSMLLRTLNNLKYDALFCLGDMVGKGGDARPFLEFLDGLRRPDRVYFICGDSDPGPFVSAVRGTQGVLSQMVLEDWILEAMARGAHYVDAPMSIQVKGATLWLSPATMLNLESVSTLEVWKNQSAQEEDGVISGVEEDYATLPITTYRYYLAQKLYEAERAMGVSDIHISLAHEAPSEEFVYTSEAHNPDTDRFLTSPELIVAGHYCGGVWRIPMVGAIYVPDRTLPRGGWFPPQELVAGLSTVDETQIYVTAGLSTNGSVPLMPFRLFNSPQISVLTLTATLPENMLEAG